MNRNPAFLLLALALGLSPLLPGVASADGGHGRGHDSYRYSYGRHDRGYYRYDRAIGSTTRRPGWCIAIALGHGTLPRTAEPSS